MSNYKYDESEEGFQQSLDLFKSAPVNTAIFNRQWISFRPISQITKGSPIHFCIPSTSSQYKDLRRTRLYLRCRILKNGVPVTEKDPVAFANLTLQSLIRQLDFSLNQRVTTSGVGLNYSYKSMLDTILLYHLEPKLSHMTSQLWFKDDSGSVDDANPDTGGNLGLYQRWEYTKNGQEVELEGGLFVDICQQNKLLLNGVQIDVKLHPNSDNFVLMSDDAESEYSYQITDCQLKICHVEINPGLILAHSDMIKERKAVYNYTKSDIRTYNIAPGSHTWTGDDLFNGSIPSRIVVGVLDGQAYSGAIGRNPYAFNHHDVSYMSLCVNGNSVPGEPLTMDYKNNMFSSAYLSLYTGTNQYRSNFGNEITREDYKRGYCLYVFNIDEENPHEFTNLLKKGHSRLTLRFNEAPKRSLSVIVYSHFPAYLEVDETRNILL